MSVAPLTREDLLARYDAILAAGALAPDARERFRAGHDLSDVIVQQSGGSGGGAPLRIPRTRSEVGWLAAKLLQHFVAAHGALPTRVALLGGISHVEAGAKAAFDGPIAVRNFTGEELDRLESFDPEVISLYPSFARELVATTGRSFSALRGIKLGGEPILSSDLEKLCERFPGVVILEQLGSTEMPGLAFRRLKPDTPDPYELSTDRFEFTLADTVGWQPLVVRDHFPDRAFPLSEWYDTGDDVRLRDGDPVEVRRRGDASHALLGDLEGLLRQGFEHVQVLPREGILLRGRGPGPAGTVRVGGRELGVRDEPPYRLVGSNKMPLVLDTDRVLPNRRYRSSS